MKNLKRDASKDNVNKSTSDQRFQKGQEIQGWNFEPESERLNTDMRAGPSDFKPYGSPMHKSPKNHSKRTNSSLSHQVHHDKSRSRNIMIRSNLHD